MLTFFSLFFQLLKQTLNAWLDNKAARLGAALAFYSVLSLSPLLMLMLAAASHIWGNAAAQGQIASQMNDIIGQQGAEAIQTILAAASANKSEGFIAGIIGLLSLLFSASAVFGELQGAMNLIWQVKPLEGKAVRVILREKLFSFMMVVGSGFLLLASVLISAGLTALSHYVNDISPLAVIAMKLINLLASFSIVVVLFAVIFKTIPDLVIPWRSVWPGALLTASLFIAGKGLIGLYLGHAGVGSSYGAAGSLVILLVWIYYSSQILFFGAEFTYIYSSHFHYHDVQRENDAK